MSTNQTSTKNWKILGISQIVLLLIMLVLSWSANTWPPLWLQLIAGIITAITVGINFTVSEGADGKKDTSDGWKIWAAAAATIISLIIYLIPLSEHAVK